MTSEGKGIISFAIERLLREHGKCEATEVNGIGSDDLLKTIYY